MADSYQPASCLINIFWKALKSTIFLHSFAFWLLKVKYVPFNDVGVIIPFPGKFAWKQNRQKHFWAHANIDDGGPDTCTPPPHHRWKQPPPPPLRFAFSPMQIGNKHQAESPKYSQTESKAASMSQQMSGGPHLATSQDRLLTRPQEVSVTAETPAAMAVSVLVPGWMSSCPLALLPGRPVFTGSVGLT